LDEGKLFLNESSASDLSAHPLISAALARRIVKARQSLSFLHWDDVKSRITNFPRAIEQDENIALTSCALRISDVAYLVDGNDTSVRISI